MEHELFTVTFWGVRGSTPCPLNQVLQYGGNTACIHLQMGRRQLILDGGTGIRQLGELLSQKDEPIKADIFVSHPHWDHIQGFPFFTPFYSEQNYFNIYGERKGILSFESIIKGIMKYPYFPIEWNHMKANFTFEEITSDISLDLGDEILVRTVELNHPGGSLGFRIEYSGKSCCYLSDMEHKEHDSIIENFVRNSDVLIYDAQYTNDEYYGYQHGEGRKGWGHSTWSKGVQLASRTQIHKLILFHHDINRTDDDIKILEQEAGKMFPNVLAAYEGLKLVL